MTVTDSSAKQSIYFPSLPPWMYKTPQRGKKVSAVIVPPEWNNRVIRQSAFDLGGQLIHLPICLNYFLPPKWIQKTTWTFHLFSGDILIFSPAGDAFVFLFLFDEMQRLVFSFQFYALISSSSTFYFESILKAILFSFKLGFPSVLDIKLTFPCYTCSFTTRIGVVLRKLLMFTVCFASCWRKS